MKAGNLEAIIVVQDVHTGSLVAFAASDSEKLDVTTPLLPLSPVKLMVAASWWDHESPTPELADSQQLLSDMIVNGNDNAGRRIASGLRKSIGTESVLKDLESYGFPFRATVTAGEKDTKFWDELSPKWRDRLTPAISWRALNQETTMSDWQDTLSIGERKFTVTALHLSRFLQAVGNGGVMLPAVARAGEAKASELNSGGKSIRVLNEAAALKLQEAMRAVVERGTAKNSANVLAGTGWQIGGKTGTGPAPNAPGPGPGSNGCFVGLAFDPQGHARFTVVTFVNHGGLGGGNAARISAELIRFLIGGDTGSSPRP